MILVELENEISLGSSEADHWSPNFHSPYSYSVSEGI